MDLKGKTVLVPVRIVDDRDSGNIQIALVNDGAVVGAERAAAVPRLLLEEAIISACDRSVLVTTGQAGLELLEARVEVAEAALEGANQANDNSAHEKDVQAAKARLSQHADVVDLLVNGRRSYGQSSASRPDPRGDQSQTA